MKGKRIVNALRKTLFFKTVFTISVSTVIMCQSASAGESHYKNFLVGSRAALMGGAYCAISDDAEGSYYNPAGIAFAYGDSVSGSGNAFHQVQTRYEKAIDKRLDYERESSALLPNFFGMIKKYGSLAVALTYVVPETVIEHQDQVFYDPKAAESGRPAISRFYMSLHSEDHVYMAGPSLAYKFNDTLSLGATLYYFYREYRLLQEQYLEYESSATEIADAGYLSVQKVEKGLSPRIGIQWSPAKSVVVGLMVSQTSLFSSTRREEKPRYYINMELTPWEIASEYTRESTNAKRKFPTQFTVGIAYYPTPFLLFSTDIDYFSYDGKTKETVMNLSFGSEVFLNAQNAIRFGIYTNNDNRLKVDPSEDDGEHIDMNGISLGYSTYSRSSSVTIGTIYSSGKGESQLGGSLVRNMERTSFTMVFAASYSY